MMARTGNFRVPWLVLLYRRLDQGLKGHLLCCKVPLMNRLAASGRVVMNMVTLRPCVPYSNPNSNLFGRKMLKMLELVLNWVTQITRIMVNNFALNNSHLLAQQERMIPCMLRNTVRTHKGYLANYYYNLRSLIVSYFSRYKASFRPFLVQIDFARRQNKIYLNI